MKRCFSVLLMMVIFLYGCSQEPNNQGIESQQIPGGILKGVSLSPRSFEGPDFSEFMERVKDTQDVLMWAGDWIELSRNGAPFTVSDLAGQYGYIPIIEVGHYDQGSGELSRPFDNENRQMYLQNTLDFVEEYQPVLVSLVSPM